MSYFLKTYLLFLPVILVSSCISQTKNEAYVKEVECQCQLLDADTGLQKETIVTGISDGKNDVPSSSVSLACNVRQTKYIKIEHKMMVNYIHDYQFYYKNKKLIKAKINIHNKEGSENQQINYSAVYYIRRNKCIKSINENLKWSDCDKVKDDSRTAFLDAFPLMNLLLRRK
ncbi:hypothetical protein EG359_04310 [Chryseobacterium joostei]|uniref:Lipoprotein n=1 Tax=Chryseobacterium joostei TaxID=112234 RepID=A0A1N7HWE0_9FLAO|nr:hypothetical protein [Chryseobacterium joostei]AZA98879.1 hypothetical protein EG359_04310 [Chryseobacterium joostei]SIS29145.1 hypothetical protein SAMN05421768_101499 [Chryseobacterium joostei]